jgi:uncharacterized membrane protein (DUF373 family)
VSNEPSRTGFLGGVDRVKHFVVATLLVILMVLVAVSTIELTLRMVTSLVEGVRGYTIGDYLLAENALLDIVGFVLTVFIVIELAESVEVYLTEEDFHAELVVLVALIAVARKIILLDYAAYDAIVYVGIAAIVAALAWAYWLLKRSRESGASLVPGKVSAADEAELGE